MAKKNKKEQNSLIMDDLLSEFMILDPVAFVENTLTIDGNPFQLSNCGRDYLHEIYRYLCLEAPGPKGKACVIKKGRQVEMTTTACCIALYIATSGAFDHVRGLHSFPQIEQARRYSKTVFTTAMKESVNGALWNKLEGDGSVSQMPFREGNFVLIEGAGDQGDRLRGIPLDYVLFDEIQDLPRAARENTQEALSHSKFGPPGFGLEMDFGTPKEENSDFQDLWNDSDQRYYHLKCPHCGHFQVMYYDVAPGKRLIATNLIEGRMVKCEDREGQGCGQIYDKRKGIENGKWVPTRNPDECGKRGYHVDQLLVPHTTREAMDQKLQDRSERAFQNEVMGNFYSGRDTGPSFAQVYDAVTTEPSTFDWRFNVQQQEKMTWAGIDWGQRLSGEDDEGIGGYTVFVVLSRLPGEKFRLEFAERLEQEKVVNTTGDGSSQLDDIIKWIRLYNCKVVGVDHGFGHVQNQILMERYPDRVKAVYSSGNVKKQFSYNNQERMITIDKHRTFEEMYDALIDTKSFAFPYSEPAKVDWLCQHLSNIEIVSKSNQSGLGKKMYVKQGPTRPIDGASALLHAFTAYKFQQTSGFVNMGTGNSFQGNRNMPTPGGATMRPIGRMRSRMNNGGGGRF